MSIYQYNKNLEPDSNFEPGELGHLVVGTRGRTLDPRRTPVSIVEIKPEPGTFVVRIEDFEDKGALWEEEFEDVVHYQFAAGSPRASDSVLREFEDAVSRLDHPLSVPCDPKATAETAVRLEKERDAAAGWLDRRSGFFAGQPEFPDPSRREGIPSLYQDLQEFMGSRDLGDLEEAFAGQFVSNPYSGELVKGHRIVIAELGLVPFEGKVIRNPALFDGAWTRERRTKHVLARMAFVYAVFAKAGRRRLSLYRGMSTEGPLRILEQRTFVSASFSIEVARSHFESGSDLATRVLMHQAVPIERVFMTYLETSQMNEQYKEAEAVLLFEEGNLAF
jgi:hypothetical protein